MKTFFSIVLAIFILQLFRKLSNHIIYGNIKRRILPPYFQTQRASKIIDAFAISNSGKAVLWSGFVGRFCGAKPLDICFGCAVEAIRAVRL